MIPNPLGSYKRSIFIAKNNESFFLIFGLEKNEFPWEFAYSFEYLAGN